MVTTDGGQGLVAHVVVTRGTLQLDALVEAAPATTVAIVGPNGAGKTTLLRALAGLEPLQRGCIVLDGIVLDDPATGTFIAPARRGVGIAFQDDLLFPAMSVLDNVAFGLRSRRVRRGEARRRAGEWLHRVGLTDPAIVSARPAQLSGGQRQRAALARVLLTEPRLLLLDEPLSSLDASARPAMRTELRKQLAAVSGVRVLVTHDPVEAASLGDQLVVLEAGRVAQCGTAAELRRRPASRFVADLVGTNLFAGTADGPIVTLETGARVVIGSTVPRNGAVQLAVHPRAVTLSSQRPEGSARNVWTGTVAGIEPGADDSRARVEVVGELPVIAEVTTAAVVELGLAPGGAVYASVKATEVEVWEG